MVLRMGEEMNHITSHKNWIRELGLKVPLFNKYKGKTFRFGLVNKKQILREKRYISFLWKRKRKGFLTGMCTCKQCFVLILLLRVTVWPIYYFLEALEEEISEHTLRVKKYQVMKEYLEGRNEKI